MKAFGFEWDWRDWSLSHRDKSEPRGNFWRQIFGLKCGTCLRWSLGCRTHWFCGMCESCRADFEDEAEGA